MTLGVLMVSWGPLLQCWASWNLNNTKLAGSVGQLDGRRSLQRDLNELDPGPKFNKVRFNMIKFWVLHFDHNNPCSAPGWGQNGWTVARQKGTWGH